MAGKYRRGISTLDRLVARAEEARLLCDLTEEWLRQLRPGAPTFQPFEVPEEAQGVGLTGATRFRSLSQTRRIHLSAASIFLFNLFARLYYAVVTHDWRNLLFTFKDLSRLPGLVAYYLFLRPAEPSYGKYTPGEKLVFSLWSILLPLAGVLGGVLTRPDHFPRLVRRLGGLSRVREKLFLTSVVLAMTVALHIYLALSGGQRGLKSMFTGWV